MCDVGTRPFTAGVGRRGGTRVSADACVVGRRGGTRDSVNACEEVHLTLHDVSLTLHEEGRYILADIYSTVPCHAKIKKAPALGITISRDRVKACEEVRRARRDGDQAAEKLLAAALGLGGM